MKLHYDQFAEGVMEMIELHKQGNNVFEMGGGNLLPYNTSQKTWQFSRKGDVIHLTDGVNAYSFKGNLGDEDTELERLTDTSIHDIFNDIESKGKAQVHRSDPGSIYFTLQEGKANPTYTFRHVGDSKWKAIPKARKKKLQVIGTVPAELAALTNVTQEPALNPMTVTPYSINMDQVKQGMLAELENIKKEADGEPQGFFKNLDLVAGRAVTGLGNTLAKLPLLPARIGGAVTSYGDKTKDITEPAGKAFGNALLAGGVGAGIGGLYHLAKRHVLNTEAENAEEDATGRDNFWKHILLPAGVMAGMNVAGRQMMPRQINNPEMTMIP